MEIILNSMLLGIFMSMLLYTIIKYLINPKPEILYYILYTVFLILLMYINQNNELYEDVFSSLDYVELNYWWVELISGAGVVIFYLLFSQTIAFKEKKEDVRKSCLGILVYTFIVDALLAFLLAFLDSFPSSSVVIEFISIIRKLFIIGALGIILCIILTFIFSRDQLVKFLGISSLFLFVGGGLITLNDHFPNSFLSTSLSYSLFQLMCFFQLVAFGLILNYRDYLLEQEKHQLESLEAAKSRFFANISHEFRTPLTLILGPTEELLKSKLSSKNYANANSIKKNANKLLQLIDQILDISRLDEGSMKLNKQRTDFVKLAKQIVSSFESFADTKSVELGLQSQYPEIWLDIDVDHFEKILSNLISNAIKYTPSGGWVKVHIQFESSSTILKVDVIDTGYGIPRELQPYIFDRFYQIDDKNFDTNYSGSGIGLALVKELIELSGAKIILKSNSKGSTFSLLIPFTEKLSTQKGEEVKTILSGNKQGIQEDSFITNNQPSSSLGLTILLIDDHEDLLTYLKNSLAEEFTIISADNGKLGIEQAIQKVPDLIITDVKMPGKDGYVVTAELKQHEITSHIPIIMLTGKSSKESKLKGLLTDADVYMNKPFSMDELRAQIKNLLSNRKRLQAAYGKYAFLTSSPDQLSSQDEVFLQKVIEIVKDNLENEEFSVTQLADNLHISRSQLYRKLEALTGKGPQEFILTFRLSHAKKLLEQNVATISEIAYSVGFSDPSNFSRRFKKVYGKSPSSIKSQYKEN